MTAFQNMLTIARGTLATIRIARRNAMGLRLDGRAGRL
jgi:hypothetical protein